MDATLQDLQDKYNKALSDYNRELALNTTGHNNYNSGNYTTPYDNVLHTKEFLGNWLSASDSGLVIYKKLMTDAKASLDDYIKNSTIATQNQFASENPQLYADLIKNQQDQGLKLVAQKSTWWIIGGVVFISMIIAGIIIYKRVKSK